MMDASSKDLTQSDSHSSISRTSSGSKRNSLRRLSHKTKLIGIRIAHPNKQTDDHAVASQDKIGDEHVIGVTDNPLFNTKQIDGEEPTLAKKTFNVIQQHAVKIAHPRQGAKQLTAHTITSSETPYLGEVADTELLQAHENLENAIHDAKEGIDHDDDVLEKQEVMDDLEEHRENLKFSWLTSKHIKRVRVVPSRPFDRPILANYRENLQGPSRWLQYVGHVGYI